MIIIVGAAAEMLKRSKPRINAMGKSVILISEIDPGETTKSTSCTREEHCCWLSVVRRAGFAA